VMIVRSSCRSSQRKRMFQQTTPTAVAIRLRDPAQLRDASERLQQIPAHKSSRSPK